jgi:hypothetical protein
MWASFQEDFVLKKAEENPATRLRKIAAAKGIGVPTARRILHEKSIYLQYPMSKALSPLDPSAKVMFW